MASAKGSVARNDGAQYLELTEVDEVPVGCRGRIPAVAVGLEANPLNDGCSLKKLKCDNRPSNDFVVDLVTAGIAITETFTPVLQSVAPRERGLFDRPKYAQSTPHQVHWREEAVGSARWKSEVVIDERRRNHRLSPFEKEVEARSVGWLNSGDAHALYPRAGLVELPGKVDPGRLGEPRTLCRGSGQRSGIIDRPDDRRALRSACASAQ